MPMPGAVLPPTSTQQAPPQQHQQQQQVSSADLEARQLAHAMAMSLTTSDSPAAVAAVTLRGEEKTRALGAVKIVAKLLGNLLQDPSQDKFKKVKLSNKTIQAKVVSVPGAVDLLVAAGFARVPDEDGEDTLCYFGAETSPELEQASGMAQLLVSELGA